MLFKVCGETTDSGSYKGFVFSLGLIFIVLAVIPISYDNIVLTKVMAEIMSLTFEPGGQKKSNCSS